MVSLYENNKAMDKHIRINLDIIRDIRENREERRLISLYLLVKMKCESSSVRLTNMEKARKIIGIRLDELDSIMKMGKFDSMFKINDNKLTAIDIGYDDAYVRFSYSGSKVRVVMTNKIPDSSYRTKKMYIHEHKKRIHSYYDVKYLLKDVCDIIYKLEAEDGYNLENLPEKERAIDQ